jgi:hypothetical protein
MHLTLTVTIHGLCTLLSDNQAVRPSNLFGGSSHAEILFPLVCSG